MKLLVQGGAAVAGAMALLGCGLSASAADAPAPIHWVRAIPMDFALEAVKAALESCRAAGKHVSAGAVDHDGNMIAMLIDDGATEGGRQALPLKLHMATLLQTTTQGNVERAAKEGFVHPEISEETAIVSRFNDHFLVQGGAVAFKVGVDYLGAVAVAGADEGTGPGSDHACAMAGFNKVKDRLN